MLDVACGSKQECETVVWKRLVCVIDKERASVGPLHNNLADTHLVIIIMLPTVKNIQNFRALNNRKGMYIEDMRKQDRPEPKQTAKHISLWVADNLKVKRFQKLGPLVVASSFISDLKEYCELNIGQ